MYLKGSGFDQDPLSYIIIVIILVIVIIFTNYKSGCHVLRIPFCIEGWLHGLQDYRETK